MATHTQYLSLRWAPELSYYEHRTEMLRAMEARGSMTAFRWHEESVGARFGQHASITVSSTGMSVSITSPKVDMEPLNFAIATVFETLAPAVPVLDSVTLKLVLPIEEQPKVAAERAGNELVSEIQPDAAVTDWSVLLDGRSQNIDAPFQVEYGIISEEEAPSRLGQDIGHIPLERSAGDVLDVSDLPQSAFFFHWRWVPLTPLGSDPASTLMRTWGLVVDESSRLSNRVQARFGLVNGTMGRAEAR